MNAITILVVDIPRQKKVTDAKVHRNPNLDANIFGASFISFLFIFIAFAMIMATHRKRL